MYQRGKFSYSQQSEMVATNRQRYSRYREQERREWNKCLASLMTQLMRWIGTQMPRSKSEAVITNFAISGCLGRGGGGVWPKTRAIHALQAGQRGHILECRLFFLLLESGGHAPADLNYRGTWVGVLASHLRGFIIIHHFSPVPNNK